MPCVIAKWMADKLELDIKPDNRIIKTVSGQIVPLLGVCYIRLHIGLTVVLQEVMVLEHVISGVLFGCSLFQNIKGSIDFHKEAMCIGNQEVPFCKGQVIEFAFEKPSKLRT